MAMIRENGSLVDSELEEGLFSTVRFGSSSAVGAPNTRAVFWRFAGRLDMVVRVNQ